jgi:hypothetical protein
MASIKAAAGKGTVAHGDTIKAEWAKIRAAQLEADPRAAQLEADPQGAAPV